jgi:RNA polymerase sigma factor (sigma-70 family)
MDVKSASGHSFEELCLCVASRELVMSHAMRFCRSRDHADDVVQEALARALRYWPSWSPRPDINPLNACVSWLLQITQNVFRNERVMEQLHFAREIEHSVEILDHTHGAVIELVSHRGPRVVGQRDNLLREVFSEEVEQAVADLRPTSRECIERFYLGNQSCAEIAAATNQSRASVTATLHRGRQQLRRLVASYAEAVYGIKTTRKESPTKPTKVVKTKPGRVKRVVRKRDPALLVAK